jgi:hypothetical protein
MMNAVYPCPKPRVTSTRHFPTFILRWSPISSTVMVLDRPNCIEKIFIHDILIGHTGTLNCRKCLQISTPLLTSGKTH